MEQVSSPQIMSASSAVQLRECAPCDEMALSMNTLKRESTYIIKVGVVLRATARHRNRSGTFGDSGNPAMMSVRQLVAACCERCKFIFVLDIILFVNIIFSGLQARYCSFASGD